MEQIILESEDGEKLPLYVLEETELQGHKYLLATEDEDGDCDAYILKEVSQNDEDSVYEIVEDDIEFDAVAKLFEELVGDEAGLDY